MERSLGGTGEVICFQLNWRTTQQLFKVLLSEKVKPIYNL